MHRHRLAQDGIVFDYEDACHVCTVWG
jgi:hypothetical protein